ncbi:hypothetical protein MZO42_16075 [Sphingomonas psychrotolerans]|uniref:Lipoprotein n=1 Tax=Sphingomonas psychrotolerans TaxID=1327635 RepID=A0ABU3N6X1_9SPHN|nr:hypothetical protein [Sphingomonas psychrotolerans]MDT8760218.1 hypothetical protein [Sphingomonas psychrotolerans]
MRVASWLPAVAAIFSSCHSTEVVEGDRQQMAAPLNMNREGVAERPLTPSILEYRHVESQASGSSPRTYIQTLEGDRWTRTFGNLTFGWGDPYVSGLTGERATPPGIVVGGQLVRLNSPDAVLAAIRDYARDLSIHELGPTGRAYIFLFPKRVDFDQTLVAARSATIPGLQRFSPLAAQCSYARLRLDQGNRQAAILLMHVPDLDLNLADAEDRTCVEQFFAQNLQIAPREVQILLYPRVSGASGGCTLARILRPDQLQASPALESAGCPTAPIRRAEVLVAFAKARGVGLRPGQAEAMIRSVENACKEQIGSERVKDESCRAALAGEK